MVRMPVLCPPCHSDQVIKGGKTKAGQHRYTGQHIGCPR
jgi:transposase-like protein